MESAYMLYWILRVYRGVHSLQVRSLKEELAARTARVTHLEFALKGKDREVGRAREEKEAARAAERERTKVCE
jgi:hypothetical protein